MMRLLILLAVLLSMLSGCRTIEYIPIESVMVDSIYLNKILRDSVIIRDSVYIHERGDTVYQYKYKYIYKDKLLHDTTYIERVDTVNIPYPVEKPLSKWENFKMNFGGYALAIGCFIILLVVGRQVIKLRK